MSDLPDDLAGLERRLARRVRPEAGAALRERVLGSVRDELRRPVRRGGAWRYAAALAAVVLLGANLSLSAALRADWRRCGNGDDQLTATAARLRQLDPELSEREARREALLLQARARLAPVPVVPAPTAGIGARATWEGD